MRGATLRSRGNLDGHNQIASLEDVVAFRLAAGQAMKIGKLDESSPSRPEDDDDRIQRSKRHRQIGRMGCDAGVGPSEDSMIAVEAVARRAA